MSLCRTILQVCYKTENNIKLLRLSTQPAATVSGKHRLGGGKDHPGKRTPGTTYYGRGEGEGKGEGWGGYGLRAQHPPGGRPLEAEDRGNRGGLRIVLSEVDKYRHMLRQALRGDSEITVGIHAQVLGGCLRVADRSHLLYVIRHSV